MTNVGGRQPEEEHLKAEEDDGSAELQPEDGGTAAPPLDRPQAQR